VIGIIGFFYPKQWEKKWIAKSILFAVITCLSVLIVIQNSKIEKLEKVSKSANLLLEKKEMEFTSEGFIMAALSFLEQNKKDFPESYERAKSLFEKYNKSEDRDITSVSVSYEMAGLLNGIAILSTVEEE
ncbi:MAG TPA: hypothetical protein VN040_14815, partial [Pseudosphingobacterium sp.]|nr:hypothetical protein [Pseudosphingobacterium sp.]